ncbi:MAG: hypothetical protein ACOWWM_19400 [Desulfobacterales bacterium]
MLVDREFLHDVVVGPVIGGFSLDYQKYGVGGVGVPVLLHSAIGPGLLADHKLLHEVILRPIVPGFGDDVSQNMLWHVGDGVVQADVAHRLFACAAVYARFLEHPGGLRRLRAAGGPLRLLFEMIQKPLSAQLEDIFLDGLPDFLVP